MGGTRTSYLGLYPQTSGITLYVISILIQDRDVRKNTVGLLNWKMLIPCSSMICKHKSISIKLTS